MRTVTGISHGIMKYYSDTLKWDYFGVLVCSLYVIVLFSNTEHSYILEDFFIIQYENIPYAY